MNNPIPIILGWIFEDADVIDGHTTELFDINLTDAEITESASYDRLCNEKLDDRKRKRAPIGKMVK